MPLLESHTSVLMIIDIQERLMPAITGAERVIEMARHLIAAARMLNVPVLATEQYPKGLGHTIPGLLGDDVPVHAKTTFDSTGTRSILDALPADKRVVVVGCEAHVCVLQTVLGLLRAGREVSVVEDGIGSRTDDNRRAACRRMEQHGADIVTSEMVIFEWLGDAGHPKFRDAMKLVK